MNYKMIGAVILIAITTNYTYSQGQGNLTESGNKHNLSSAQTGVAIQATIEDRICVFCHTPHRSYTDTPLWNHTLSNASYTVSLPPGASGTQLSTPENPPDGTSKLCLSCHDGTVSLGAVQNIGGQTTTISMQVVGLGPLVGPAVLSTDLSGHHLVSVVINADLRTDKEAQCGIVSFKIKDGITAPYVQPTANTYSGQGGDGVQCNSCHDPHYDPTPGTTKFLRAGATPAFQDPLCCQCHIPCSGAPCL